MQRSTITAAVSIVVFALGLQACSAGGSAPIPASRIARSGVLPSFPTSLIYSTNYDANSVTEYGAFANGDVRPLRTIAGPHTKMDRPIAVAVDSAGNLYVDDFSYTSPHISVFAPGADGDTAPVRTINSKSFGGVHPFGMCVDAQDYLYEADTYTREIRVFAPGADGDVAPVRTVFDQNIGSPVGVFVDERGHLWVTDSFNGAVLEFPPNANGKMHAGRRISGSATRLQTPVGVTRGPDGTIYVADVNAKEVFAFAASAGGNTAPIRAFAPPGPSTPGYGVVYHNGALYVSLEGGQPTEYAVAAFKPTSNGTTTPLREITGPDTMIEATGIAVH